MSWTPLSERLSNLPLILAGPILRRTEPQAVTVWLALKEPQKVTLRIYARNAEGKLIQQCEGTQHTIRLGDYLHLIAVTAHCTASDEPLAWGGLYYYDLFFEEPNRHIDARTLPVPETAAHLETPGILNTDPSQADLLHRLLYSGHPLPSFVLPHEDINQLRVVHGSCRKPHGVGREMLSALDTILETTIQQGTKRPQQLFLTGDQIYADDVAAPLLFALIDAGNTLFSGNEPEVLPEVHIPACDLAPGGRADIVRNKALLTTTTPQNQLLALREYATMYLFAWSDVLWPAELPDAQQIWKAYPQIRPTEVDKQQEIEEQYATQLEQLEEFRARLPHVRRALANIATYTICDDHEITDDWFLDGAWCQIILANPLGRHVVRNGLLAYALFQAWGNTPQQFAESDGMALLNAVDSWRGNETDAWTETIDELLGLPPAFSGTGELQHSPRSLHWYHTYEGPRYQVIVMDTRTQRLYRSPHAFPGLLSPYAIQVQVGSAARQVAEVTIIISATPVLGVDFIESIQLWSHWFVKENYAYDCEAWALDWGTFQHFLRTVSDMKRTVFLSGDVHYAFGSSMEYWDQQTHATAKLVDYTSSPFHNEGSGSHIAMLAIGYPRLLHLLRRQGTPTMDFFAWDIATGEHHVFDRVLSLIRQRIYQFWWAIPRLLAMYRSPDEIVMPAHDWLKDAFHDCPPDRVYRIRYLRNTLALVALRKRDRLHVRASSWVLRLLRLALGAVTFVESYIRRISRRFRRKAQKDEQASDALALPAHTLAHEAAQGTALLARGVAKPGNRLTGAILHYARMLNRLKAGELIVGYNNLGEIHFEWTQEKKLVVQRLWWHPDDPSQPLRKTDYSETLDLPEPDAAPPLP